MDRGNGQEDGSGEDQVGGARDADRFAQAGGRVDIDFESADDLLAATDRNVDLGDRALVIVQSQHMIVAARHV